MRQITLRLVILVLMTITTSMVNGFNIRHRSAVGDIFRQIYPSDLLKTGDTGLNRFERRQAENSSFISYTNCGDPESDLIKVNLDFQSDPFDIPAKVNVSGTIEVTEPLEAPIEIKVDIFSRLYGNWIRIPCTDGVGSCTYGDICDYLDFSDYCPEEVKESGFDCKCPLPAGKWDLEEFTVELDNDDVEKPIEARVRLEITSNAKLASCADITITLE